MSRDYIADEPITVIFSLMCGETRAWVVLSRSGTSARVVEMWQPRPGYWSACAVLSPGDYRCRCYAGSDRMVSYCGPPQVDGGTERGMDVMVAVRGSPSFHLNPVYSTHRSEMAHA